MAGLLVFSGEAARAESAQCCNDRCVGIGELLELCGEAVLAGEVTSGVVSLLCGGLELGRDLDGGSNCGCLGDGSRR